jgi:hypothetical protein
MRYTGIGILPSVGQLSPALRLNKEGERMGQGCHEIMVAYSEPSHTAPKRCICKVLRRMEVSWMRTSVVVSPTAHYSYLLGLIS